MKRLFSTLLVVLLLLTFISTNNNSFELFDGQIKATAANYQSGLFKYSINGNNEITITGHTLSKDSLLVGQLDIPEEIDGFPVKRIDYYAFKNCVNVSGVIFPESILEIRDQAFQNCSAISGVVLPPNLQSIGSEAFSGTAIHSVTIPKTVKALGSAAFGGLSPFKGNSLVSVRFEDGIETIPSFAFNGCIALSFVSIPSTVTAIQVKAFQGCESLNNIVFPENLEKIGSYAFSDTAINDIFLPNTITVLGTPAYDEASPFKGNALQRVEFEDGIESVPMYSFNGCTALTDVILPPTVTSIGVKAFQSCKHLSDFHLPERIEIIGSSAFSDTDITEIELPNSISSLGNASYSGKSAYSGKMLEKASFKSGIESIPRYAFNGCTNLKEVFIPNSVSSIQSWAFNDCESLSDVYFEGDLEQWLALTIGENNKSLASAKIHYNQDFILSNAVFPSGYDFEFDRIPIKNHSGSIDRNLYIKMFGLLRGLKLYAKKEKKSHGGMCYGFANATGSILRGYPDVKSFERDYLCNITEDDYNPILRGTFYDFLRMNYIFQYSSYVAKCLKNNKSLSKLVEAAKGFTNGNDEPIVVVLTYKEGGKHALYVIGVDGDDILVNDSNRPNMIKRIHINGNEWEYFDTTWDHGSAKGDSISFVPCSFVPYFRMVSVEQAITDLLIYKPNHISINNILYPIESISDSEENVESDDDYLYWADNVSVVSAKNDSLESGEIQVADNYVGIKTELDSGELAEVSIGEECQLVLSNICDKENQFSFETVNQQFGCPQILSILVNAQDNKLCITKSKNIINIKGALNGKASLSIDDHLVKEIVFTSSNNTVTISYDDNGESDSFINVSTFPSHEKHTYNSIVSTLPTCTTNGTLTYTCSECDDSYTESIPSLGHVDKDNDGKCDRCKQQMTGGNHCKYCGKIHNEIFGWLVKFFHSILAIFKR